MENYRISPRMYSDVYVSLTQLKKGILDAVTKHAKSKDVLVDYGCGDMPYRPLIAEKIGKYIGADLSDNKQADVVIGLDSKISLEDEFADIVLSTQVLEHVLSPTAYLQEANRILKKNGVLILSTHGTWKYHPSPNDLWRWTSAGLKKQVEEAGFEIVEFKGFMGLMAIGIQLFQDGLHKTYKNKYIYAFINIVTQNLIRFFDQFQSQEQKDEDASIYVLVAFKK